jgi:hypothetical protein
MEPYLNYWCYSCTGQASVRWTKISSAGRAARGWKLSCPTCGSKTSWLECAGEPRTYEVTEPDGRTWRIHWSCADSPVPTPPPSPRTFNASQGSDTLANERDVLYPGPRVFDRESQESEPFENQWGVW